MRLYSNKYKECIQQSYIELTHNGNKTHLLRKCLSTKKTRFNNSNVTISHIIQMKMCGKYFMKTKTVQQMFGIKLVEYCI